MTYADIEGLGYAEVGKKEVPVFYTSFSVKNDLRPSFGVAAGTTRKDNSGDGRCTVIRIQSPKKLNIEITKDAGGKGVQIIAIGEDELDTLMRAFDFIIDSLETLSRQEKIPLFQEHENAQQKESTRNGDVKREADD